MLVFPTSLLDTQGSIWSCTSEEHPDLKVELNPEPKGLDQQQNTRAS